MVKSAITWLFLIFLIIWLDYISCPEPNDIDNFSRISRKKVSHPHNYEYIQEMWMNNNVPSHFHHVHHNDTLIKKKKKKKKKKKDKKKKDKKKKKKKKDKKKKKKAEEKKKKKFYENLTRIEYCLLDTTGDVPEHVKIELIECMRYHADEKDKIMEDIMREAQACYKVFEKLVKKMAKCKKTNCLLKVSSTAGNYLLIILYHVGWVMYEMILLSSASIQVPLCFSEPMTYKTGTEAVNMMIDIVQCL